ncbi:MAG: hypothetical protein AAFV53_15360 [Myxococcota bacterium]
MWIMLWMACHLHSGLFVPAREQFVLGDNPHGRFSVKVENIGEVPVDLVVHEDGEPVSTVTLSPGDRTKSRFTAEQTALFVNHTDREASLSVDVVGDVGLSMDYAPLP